MARETLMQMLRKIGLSELEANIYIWLLENKRSTGYKISGQIGKPVANTYKALKSLQKKGAVVSDVTTGTKYFDTIPVEEFLNKLQNEFTSKKEKILNEVENLEVYQEQRGIYELGSEELVYEKVKSMISTAEKTLLIDAFPAPLKEISKFLEKAKDTAIYLKSYSAETINNTRQIKASLPDLPYNDLNGQWLIVLKDTTESLIAFFNKDCSKLIHAIWTCDPFLSFVLFNGSAYEFNCTEIIEQVHSNEEHKIENIMNIINHYKNMYKYMRVEEKNFIKENEQ